MFRAWGFVAVLVIVCSCGSSKSDDAGASGGAQSSGGAAPNPSAGRAGASAGVAGAGAGKGGLAESTAGDGNAGGDRNQGGASGEGGEGGEGGTDTVDGCSTGNIHVRATRVSGKVTINGTPFTGTKGEQEFGDLVLRNAAGDSAKLTTISASADSYATFIVPGKYDLYYAHNGDGRALPLNGLARLQSGIVVGKTPVALDIDLPVATVSGKVTVDGKAITDATTQGSAFIDLYSDTQGDARISSTSPDGGVYTARVIAGSYDLYSYATVDPGSTVPGNYLGKVRSGIVVGPSATTLDIDLPTTTVTVSIAVNGTPLSTQAALSLRNENDRVELRRTSPSGNSFSAPIIPGGTYDLYYTTQALGAGVLANSAAVIRKAIVIGSSPLSLNVDVAATVVSGSLTTSSGPPINTDNGGFYLATATGDQVDFPVVNGSFSGLAVPGTYDLYLDGWLAGVAGLPGSTVRLKSAVVVGSSPVSLAVSIPQPTVASGTVTLNGAPIPADHPFNLYFSQPMIQGVPATIAGGSYSASVFPGTYDLTFTNANDGGNVLPNSFSSIKLAKGVVVGASPLTLNVDIPAAPISGFVTLNGAKRGDLASQLSHAFNVTSSNGEEGEFGAEIASTVRPDSSYSSLLIPGTYEIYYYGRDLDDALPTNERADLGCLIVR